MDSSHSPPMRSRFVGTPRCEERRRSSPPGGEPGRGAWETRGEGGGDTRGGGTAVD
jgi:hypothetical protein